MNDRLTILNGDALEKLREMESESVQCCVTSPPYWGLRDYGTAKWEGGDAECTHVIDPAKAAKQFRSASTLNGSTTRQEHHGSTRSSKTKCVICGAKRIDSQLGLEKTPEEYVANMVAVFREVRRVLKQDGTCWINLGDSYAGSWGAQSRPNGNDNGSTLQGGSMLSARQIEAHPRGQTHTGSLKNTPGLKQKDLVGIPWMVAFALRADGWYLRQDIIWSKPNPMPESVRDRCTKAHEYIFLLSKESRYHYDAEAIKEPASNNTNARRAIRPAGWANGADHSAAGWATESRQGRQTARKLAEAGSGVKNNRSFDDAMAVMPDERNKRSVWTVPSYGFSEAHFATFPPDLIKPCILAGCPVNGTVIDPFGGSGTTGMVALELGRKAILIELNPEYVKLIERRCDVTPGLALT